MWGVSEKWIISLADTFLWLKRFLFNSFIFLLGDSRVANKPEESKGGHASQKSEKCCIKITSDAVPVLQFMCHRVTFSLLHGCKVLQGITQTSRMIQSARVLHLECWDKWRGGGEFLSSRSYECWHMLHVPAKVNSHLHSAEPLGWQVTKY